MKTIRLTSPHSFLFLIVSTFSLLQVSYAQEPEPLIYVIESETAKIYILGGTDARDDSWFTSKVESALTDSDELWVEVPPADPATGVPPLRDELIPSEAAEMHPVAIEEGYGNLRFGDFFGVAMGERSVVESQRLGISGVNFQAMQPWLAGFLFQEVFWAIYSDEFVNTEISLIEKARTSGKTVRSFFADRAEYYRFLGRMNDFAQTHYFQYIYNTFDWQRSGEYESRFDWAIGQADNSVFLSIQNKTPDYYRYMYQRRNPVMAQQVADLLPGNGTYFLYLDINRFFGESSILNALTELGIDYSVL